MSNDNADDRPYCQVMVVFKTRAMMCVETTPIQAKGFLQMWHSYMTTGQDSLCLIYGSDGPVYEILYTQLSDITCIKIRGTYDTVRRDVFFKGDDMEILTTGKIHKPDKK